MNPEVKNLWVNALRSGDFKQTKSLLGSEDGYCCLGVLCEIAVEKGIVSRSYNEDNEYVYGGEVLVLPDSVVDWAGLGESNPWVTWKNPEDAAIENGPISNPNDNGVPFSDIADIIEDQL